MNDGEIVATVMATLHTDMVYIADFIVSEKLSGHKADDPQGGLGQAILYKMFEIVKVEFPEIKSAWYIAGGDGANPAGRKISENFNAKQLDSDAQKEAGLILLFNPPGEILIAARQPQAEEHRSFRP